MDFADDPIPHADRLTQGTLANEAKMLEAMICGYCQRHHGSVDALCDECRTLLHYAKKRLACCPFHADKPTCARCTIHCYRSPERKAIKRIMRTMGPKMIFLEPRLAIEHMIRSFKTPPPKPRNKRKN